MQYLNAKIVLVGDAGVGKTCVLNRETCDVFDNSTLPTMGASFTSRVYSIDDKEVHLQIWDTAGQERYKSMAPMYYRDSKAAIIMYSIIDIDSFNQIEFWIQSIKESEEDIALYIVGNKVDLVQERIVSIEDAEKLADKYSAVYFEVSAKTSIGVHELFLSISRDFLNKSIAEPKSVCTKIEMDSSQNSCC